MKWILVLYVCGMVTEKCPDSSITGFQYNTYYDCVLGGYKVAHNTFKNLNTLEELEKEYMEREKIVIKFECKGVNTAT